MIGHPPRPTSETMPSRLFLGVLILVVCALAFYAWTRYQDRFLPDTDQGHIALVSPRVIAGDAERLIRLQPVNWQDNGMAGIPKLNDTMKVGDEVVAGISVPVYGEYHWGGGWIFRGREYEGHYGVSGDLLSVESSHPEVLEATLDERGNLRLKASDTGQSRLTLTATMSRRYANREDNAAIHTDTITFKVVP